MKRNSILYDYKPRIEWVDLELVKRRKRRKRILLASASIAVIGFAGLISSIKLPSEVLFDSKGKTLKSTPLSENRKNNPVIKEPLKLFSSSPQGDFSEETVAAAELAKKKTFHIDTPPKDKPDTKTSAEAPYKPSPEPTTNTPVVAQKKYKLVKKDGWQELTVKEGDNLSLIFSQLAIKKNDLYEILSLGQEIKPLKNLKPGQILRLKFDGSNITKLVHETDLIHRLEVTKENDQFQASTFEEHPIVKLNTSSGTIEDSLFLSGQKAGLSENVIMQMFEIFGWDIDFVLDIRKGDEFHVIYEELMKDGKKIKDGKILAAEFVNQGRAFKAVRYQDSEGTIGYYSEQGKSMKKAFLRTPVNFTRISSHFNLARKHPVLNKIRAHKGVDYAAPTGTPVQTTGNGRILFAGKKNGYGNTVIIQHGGKYQTLYAHLSRFTRGLKKGQRVEQGQTVGYVGQTGMATGPHLHYEFRIDGQHRNPLTVDLPKSLPLPKQYMKDFEQQTKILIAQLNALTDKFQVTSFPVMQQNKPMIKLAKSELVTPKTQTNIH